MDRLSVPHVVCCVSQTLACLLFVASLSACSGHKNASTGNASPESNAPSLATSPSAPVVTSGEAAEDQGRDALPSQRIDALVLVRRGAEDEELRIENRGNTPVEVRRRVFLVQGQRLTETAHRIGVTCPNGDGNACTTLAPGASLYMNKQEPCENFLSDVPSDQSLALLSCDGQRAAVLPRE